MLVRGPSRGGWGLGASTSIRRLYRLSNHPGSSRWLLPAPPCPRRAAIFIFAVAAPAPAFSENHCFSEVWPPSRHPSNFTRVQPFSILRNVVRREADQKVYRPIPSARMHVPENRAASQPESTAQFVLAVPILWEIGACPLDIPSP
jgi:hypothetical protein